MTASRITVLLVDDDELDRRAVLRAVQEQQLPYGVTPAASLAEACRLLRERTFDVAIVDYGLADGVGTDLIPDLGGTPMVVVTGSGSEQIAVAAIRQGAYDYVVKDPERRYLILLPATISAVLARRRAEVAAGTHARELARSNAELDRFAGAIAHDLKNPVGTILGYAELLLAENPGLDASSVEHLQSIVRTAVRMGSMIKEVLDYARIAQSAKTVGVVDLGAVVGEIVEDLAGAIHATGGTVEALELPVVRGDAPRLRQLLQNLIANALKFRRDDAAPAVRIAAREVTNGWEVCVADNGVGIEHADHDRIFRLFERVKRQGAPEVEGIGLALCRRIVDQHGGQIWVDSEPGCGATFHFTLARNHVTQPASQLAAEGEHAHRAPTKEERRTPP